MINFDQKSKRKKSAALFVIASLVMLLVSTWASPPPNEAIESVWRNDIVPVHTKELMRLIGPQAYDFIVFEDFYVKEIQRLDNGRFRALYLFRLRLTQPLDALEGMPSGSALSLIRTMFPQGVVGETSSASGSLELERTGEDWHSV